MPHTSTSAPDVPEASRPSSNCVFFTAWALLLAGFLFPEAPQLNFPGIGLLVLSILMIVRPPEIGLPRWIYVLAGLFLALSAGAFLPKSWFTIPAWRQGLEAAGLATGSQVTAHPEQSWWQWWMLAAAVLSGLFLLGHRVTEKWHLRLAWMFSLAVAIMAGLAILAQVNGWQWPGDDDPSFGFYPNRNHTATVLALGVVTALGCLLQALRAKQYGLSGLSSLTLCVCLGAALGFCTSRSVLGLIGLGGVVWLGGLGKRYWSKKLAFTVLGLVALAGAMFLWMGGELLHRVTKTAERVNVVMSNDPSATTQQITTSDTTLDFRQLVFKDAWTMIKQEPLTGVGMGMFGFVFPQYRQASASAALCVHPESDWLMLAAEQGLGAALVLAAGVAGLLLWGWRQARYHHSWVLRWNGIVAAGIVVVHGLIDVPGHRFGIVLAGLFLLGITLRMGTHPRLPTKLATSLWRGCGIIGLVCAVVHLSAPGNNPIARPAALLSAAHRLYAEDTADRKVQPNPPAEAEDKLETAMGLLDQALQISPLAADLHFFQGYLALNYTDKYDQAEEEFGYQRKLAPLHVEVPMRQAYGWAPIKPELTKALWQDGLQRSVVMGRLAPGKDWGHREVVEAAIYNSRVGNEALKMAALDLCHEDEKDLVIWSLNASPELLNKVLPALLKTPLKEETKAVLIKEWERKGHQP